MSTRRLDYVLSIDAGAGVDTGYQKALAKNKAFNAQLEAMNKRITDAQTRLREGKSGGVGEGEMANRKAAVEAARDQRNAAVGEFKIKTDLDNKYYAMTHSEMENDLRKRDLYYERLREKHAKNNVILTQIERNQIRDRAMIRDQHTPISKDFYTANDPNAGQKAFMKTGAGKNLAKMYAIEAGGMISPELGAGAGAGAAGSMMGMSGTQAVGVGALVAGLKIGEAVYASMKEQSKALAESQQRHAQSTRDSVVWLSKLASGYNVATKAGAAFEQQAEEERKAIAAIVMEEKKRRAAQGLMDTNAEAVSSWQHGGSIWGEKSDAAKARNEAHAEMKDREKRAKQYKAWAKDEQQYAKQTQIEDAQSATKAAQINADITDSASKQRRQQQLQHTQEKRKFNVETNEANRQFVRSQKAIDAEIGEVEKNMEGKGQGDSYTREQSQEYSKNKNKLAELKAQKKEEIEANAEFNGQRGALDEEVAKRRAFEVEALDRQIADEEENRRVQQAQSADQAVIDAKMTGFGREKATLKLKQDAELAAANKAGEDTTEIKRRHQAEGEGMQKQHNLKLADLTDDLDMQLAVTTKASSRSEAAWSQMGKQLARDFNLTGQALEDVHQKFLKLSKAQANQGLIDDVKNLNIELELAHRKISEVEAARQRLRQANPEADQKNIDALAEKQQALKMAQYGKEITKSLHPMKQYLEEYKKLKEARRAGELSEADFRQAARNKALQLSGGMNNGGQFTDAESHWKSIQSGIMSDANIPKAMLEELKDLRKEAEHQRTEGIKIKAA